MDTLTVPYEIKQIDEQEEFYTFEGYGSTFGNVDLGDDRVIKGAFLKTIESLNLNARQVPGTSYRAILPTLYQHKASDPVGVFTQLREDERGLLTNGIMPKTDTFVSGRLVPQMKIGSIGKLSIGYVANVWEMNGDVRDLKEIGLREISIVTFPMNEEAEITGIKGATSFADLPLASRERTWDASAAAGRVRTFTGSESEPNTRYRRAFFWYDQSSPELFGSYKLPFADVIDGELKAVPRAIFNAAARLNQTNIPEADKQAVMRHMNRYYDKMGLDSPFSKGISYRIDNLEDFTEREIEKMLTSGVGFNRKTALKITSSIKSLLKRDVKSEDDRRDAVKWGDVISELNKIKL